MQLKKEYKKLRMRNFYLILTVVMIILLFYFSVAGVSRGTKGAAYSDKLEHFLAYFLLSFLLYKTISQDKIAFLAAGTYGLLLEFVQLALPYRNFSFSDIAVNYFASSLILLYKKLEPK